MVKRKQFRVTLKPDVAPDFDTEKAAAEAKSGLEVSDSMFAASLIKRALDALKT